MKKFSTAFLLAFLTLMLQAQQTKHTISGFVREDKSGESLIGVNIYAPSLRTGTTTNTYGFYSLTVPQSGTIELVFSYVGYNPETFTVELDRDVEFNVSLKPGVVLGEVTVNAERVEKQSESVKMSTVNLQPQQVKNVPSLLGEKDVLKVLQLMPGVQKGSEGNSGIYVRGGGPDQNLIILDDAIVYNASHLFGFFSLFNGDALKSVELTKGGFPARYGGRLSSVLDMNMKDGNKEEWHGNGGLGLISSRMTIEGPLKKNKSSILLSGRRTYADLFARPILKLLKYENTGYYFYDFNAKINYDFGRKNKLYLSGYFGKDKFYLKNNMNEVEEDAGFLWKNSSGTLRWNHLYNNKLFSNTSLVFSKYNFSIFDKYRFLQEKKDYYASYNSGITDYTFKHDIDFIPNTKHTVKTGIVFILHEFKPYAFVEIDKFKMIDEKKVKATTGIESGAYFEDTWHPLSYLKINAGVRFSHFAASQKQYHYLEPRIAAAVQLRNDYALKASYSEMNQYIHLISNTGISLPTDLWVPTTNRIKPQHSRQVAGGIVKDLADLSVSVEAYYKSMNDVIGYKEGATFLSLNEPGSSSGTNWEDNVTTGRSWSYGSEFLIQRKTGRLTGWIAYTLSWTQMQFDSLNFGRKFYARYDRRHDISVVAIYKLTDRITLSGTWVYGTGNAITMPVSEYIGQYHMYTPTRDFHDVYWEEGRQGRRINDYGDKNNFRMGSYHRMDVGIQFHKKKKHWDRTWEISLYNAYSRKNPFYYYIEHVWPGREPEAYNVKQVTLFPLIPSVTWA
ncbi:MAG: TonB-dependent receptor, partial [Chloroflexota bacterium]